MAPAWQETVRPPGEVRGVGELDGAVVASTSDGLFALEEKAWRALDAAALGASVLPSGRLVVRRLAGPPTATEAAELTAFAAAPDGAVWMWGRIDDGVLAWTGDRWASRNLGLTVIPRKGSRSLRTRSLAVVGGALHVATSIGVFRRELR